MVAALIPNIAAWATGLIDNALAAAGTTAAAVGDEALDGAGVVYDGLHMLGQGAILAGLVLGAIVASSSTSGSSGRRSSPVSGAVLSFVGLIHGERIEWNANGPVALGYLFVAAICAVFALGRPAPRVPEPEEAELDRRHEPSTPDTPTGPAAPGGPAATADPADGIRPTPAVSG